MKRRYKNPPILEAICEIHFQLATPFTETDLLSLGEVWKGAYPSQAMHNEKAVEVQVNLGQTTVKETPSGQRLIARSEDGRKLTQLSSSFLAVNQLQPYPGWRESFQADIQDRLNEVVAKLGVTTIGCINLRYIDQLHLPQNPLTWSEWFSFALPIPQGVSETGVFFQSHFQQKLEPDLFAAINIASLPSTTAGQTSVILDTTIMWTGVASVQDCSNLLERVHLPHTQIFDGFLTAKTQALLGAYETV